MPVTASMSPRRRASSGEPNPPPPITHTTIATTATVTVVKTEAPEAPVAPVPHTFRVADELRQIYERDNRLQPGNETIAYCRIGERSSHTWFVLSYLLGHPRVRNYDGSWTEWGNSVRLPIER